LISSDYLGSFVYFDVISCDIILILNQHLLTLIYSLALMASLDPSLDPSGCVEMLAKTDSKTTALL
jgi:hypothetical protein